jgi:multidrug efflux pump subunit AcrB
VSIELGGDSANIRTVFTSFGITLGLAVVCIVAVLLLLFRNWVDPFIIVLALPLAVVGAVLGLLVVRSEFGMISLLGIVFLFGLVNKNAILLVDYINQLRAAGTECGEAIRRAGAVRLRPILMTTLATILGMMPIAIGLGVGSELRAPMAVAIIGGLITSTLLSLLVVPVVYASLRGIGKKNARKLSDLRAVE